MKQKRSIKSNSELPVAIHEVRDGQRSGYLSSLLCLTRKRNVSQGKDKEKVILIRLTFQESFLVSFFSGFSMIISFSFHISIHCFNSLFSLIFPTYLNKN